MTSKSLFDRAKEYWQVLRHGNLTHSTFREKKNPEIKFSLNIRMASIAYQLLLKLVLYIFLELCTSESRVVLQTV